MADASTSRLRAFAESNAATAWLTLLIVTLYAILGLRVLEPDAVYSGDIGVKFVQARALVASHFSSLDIPYPGQLLDPSRAFFPMRAPFVMMAHGETQAIFSPLSACVQALGVAVAGMQGMTLISLLSGALILLATWRLAAPGQSAAVVFALGFAGPLWFYAISGWEHAPAVALSTMAFAIGITGPDRASALAAGLCLGAGATLRDEVLLLAPGLALAVWCRHRRLLPVVATAAGAALVLALAAAIEVWWFQRPVAAHLRHAVHLLQSALHVSSEPNPDVPALRPFTIRERYETVVQYWLLGYGDDRLIAAYSVGLAAALAVRVWLRSSIGILLWLAAIAGLAAIDLHELVTAPKWLAGLLRVSPYLVFAILPLPLGAVRRGWFVPAMLETMVIYLALAFAGADTSGGKSLGPRLLLPLMPLLTVAAIGTIAGYLRAPARIDRVVGWAGGLLIGMSAVMHGYGTVTAYVARNHDDAAAVQALTASPERVVVADDPFTAQLLFPLYYRKIVVLADSPDLGTRLGEALTQARVNSAVLVSRQPDPAIPLAPLRLERTEPRGRMTLQYWKR